MKKHGYYQYRIWVGMFLHDAKNPKNCSYEIYNLNTPPELIIASKEWFDSEAQASFAAIGHIALLENGEG